MQEMSEGLTRKQATNVCKIKLKKKEDDKK